MLHVKGTQRSKQYPWSGRGITMCGLYLYFIYYIRWMYVIRYPTIHVELGHMGQKI